MWKFLDCKHIQKNNKQKNKSAESAFKPKQTGRRNAAKLNFRFLLNTKLYPLIFCHLYHFNPPPMPLRRLGALPAAATLPANPIPDQRPTQKEKGGGGETGAWRPCWTGWWLRKDKQTALYSTGEAAARAEAPARLLLPPGRGQAPPPERRTPERLSRWCSHPSDLSLGRSVGSVDNLLIN